MVGQIVEIHSENNRRSTRTRNRCDDIHQLGFAVITTIDVIGAVCRSLHLGRVDRNPRQSPFVRQVATLHFFGTGQARRHGCDSNTPVRAEHSMSDKSEKGGVGTTTECHRHRIEFADDGLEFGDLRVEWCRGRCLHSSHRAMRGRQRQTLRV